MKNQMNVCESKNEVNALKGTVLVIEKSDMIYVMLYRN